MSRISTALFISLILTTLLSFPALAAEHAMAKVPFSLSLGKNSYKKHCVECHGIEGVGSDKGPPLIHKYYEPSHHGNAAFYRAMTTGVKQHHWNFGDMAPVPGLDQKKMMKIIEYVRWLQRRAGIH